jgi:hypothetical protein
VKGRIGVQVRLNTRESPRARPHCEWDHTAGTSVAFRSGDTSAVAEVEPLQEQKNQPVQPRVEMRLNIGELLLKENRVVPWQIQDARNYQDQKGGTISRALVRLGFVEDEEMAHLLSRQYGVPSITLDPLTIDPAIIEVIPAEMARTHKVLPLSRSGDRLTVAMADPTSVLALDDVRLTTGFRVEPVVASEAALEDAIDLCYGPARSTGSRRDTALAEASAKSARTAWQYVAAMHAAALGAARRPIRGIVEDVEDMRVRLTRERDEARARVAELERQLAEATAEPPRPGRRPSARP